MTATPLLPGMVDRIREGAYWEGYAAAACAFCGFSVEMGPRRVRDEAEPITTFSEQVDLVVNGIPVEVKSRSISFTSPSDVPFEQLTICRYTGALPTVPYLIISAPTRRIVASLPGIGERTVAPQRDAERGYSCPSVQVHRDSLVPFSGFVDWMRERTR